MAKRKRGKRSNKYDRQRQRWAPGSKCPRCKATAIHVNPGIEITKGKHSWVNHEVRCDGCNLHIKFLSGKLLTVHGLSLGKNEMVVA